MHAPENAAGPAGCHVMIGRGRPDSQALAPRATGPSRPHVEPGSRLHVDVDSAPQTGAGVWRRSPADPVAPQISLGDASRPLIADAATTSGLAR